MLKPGRSERTTSPSGKSAKFSRKRCKYARSIAFCSVCRLRAGNPSAVAPCSILPRALPRSLATRTVRHEVYDTYLGSQFPTREGCRVARRRCVSCRGLMPEDLTVEAPAPPRQPLRRHYGGRSLREPPGGGSLDEQRSLYCPIGAARSPAE